MSISDKIEEIRQKPEHIRLRYVWGSVAILMFFIIIIWIFSLGESFKKIPAENQQALPDLKQSIEDLKALKDNAPSVNDLMNSSNKAAGGEGVQNQPENNSDQNTNQ